MEGTAEWVWWVIGMGMGDMPMEMCNWMRTAIPFLPSLNPSQNTLQLLHSIVRTFGGVMKMINLLSWRRIRPFSPSSDS